jgi:ABC-2 type transport system permease protein
MIRNVITLVAHDLAVAFKNKTIFLMICIPFFIYGTLMLVDRRDAPTSVVRLGLLKMEFYDPAVRKSIESAPGVFSVREVKDVEEGMHLLKDRELDGLVINADNDPSRVAVLVVKTESPATFAIVQRFSALQLAAEGGGRSWISSVRPIQSGGIELQALPTWILMVVLLVSFFVIPAQVAEEKEKQLLLGLLQTPVREGEWLAAKLLYATILMFTVVLALQLLANSWPAQWTYLAMFGAGSFCFGAMGIALGLLCRTQASARTLGVICYLPLFLPAALSGESRHLKAIAPFLPSHAFYEPIQSIFLEDKHTTVFPVEWLTLVVIGVTACMVAYRLIKVRWLM